MNIKLTIYGTDSLVLINWNNVVYVNRTEKYAESFSTIEMIDGVAIKVIESIEEIEKKLSDAEAYSAMGQVAHNLVALYQLTLNR